MGGRLVTNEDSGEVFLWRSISGVRRRSYSALQELDSSPLLPFSKSGRPFKSPRHRNFVADWIQRRLFGDGVGHSCKEVRPLGR